VVRVLIGKAVFIDGYTESIKHFKFKKSKDDSEIENTIKMILIQNTKWTPNLSQSGKRDQSIRMKAPHLDEIKQIQSSDKRE